MKKVSVLIVLAISLFGSGHVYAEREKKLTPAQAYERYVDQNKLSYTVTDKLYDDHMIDGASNREEICNTYALGRYEKNGTTKTSWIFIDESKLKSKVAGSTNKRASVHAGKQQLTVKIKVERYTMEVEELTRTEAPRYKNVIERDIKGETKYLLCNGSRDDVDVNIVGPWDPLTGKVELYHYEANAALGEHAMLDKYLVWITDDSGNTIIRPKAAR